MLELDCGCRARVSVSGDTLKVDWESCGVDAHESWAAEAVAMFCAQQDIRLVAESGDSVSVVLPPSSEVQTAAEWGAYVVAETRRSWRKRGRKSRVSVVGSSEERTQAVRELFTSLELDWIDFEVGEGPEAA